ncbi:MAG: carboxy-S-adenosyl-L-methionine synthase CmoA [Desulfuromonadales bacterium]|nr:carboxy-S-adenosyl-L-methionine synthase CmoA [Desulfuromonadales bacterium]MDW7758066.1 carboxy-S-adenosyl-L-methionine synthase CmoA [Desulfuromonadales bacterium]
MKQDKVFAEKKDQVEPFSFNEQVVRVFDDMIGRSVPLYRENIRRQAQLAARYYQPGSRIYDLGCSNGNLGLCLCQELAAVPFDMIAVDNSAPMLDAYQSRLQDHARQEDVQLLLGDVREIPLANASVIIVNLTLQFLPLTDRTALIGRIYEALRPGGILLLTEKVVHADAAFDAMQQEFYYRFKKENGYSQLEISQKREALENVLIPETLEDHVQRLRAAGFIRMDVWLKWFNFASLIGQKEDGHA